MTKWRRILAAVLIAPLLLAGLPARAQMLQGIVNGASPSRWMLFGQRGHIFAGADAVIGSNNYGASRILFSTAAWPVTSIKVYYPNWYGGNTISPYEGTPGSSLYIDGAVVETVANTTFATLKFGASPTITLADGADVWSDTLVFSTPIPANSTFWIRTAFHRANTTDNTFGQYAANGNTASGATGNGEGLISGTSTEVAHLSG